MIPLNFLKCTVLYYGSTRRLDHVYYIAGHSITETTAQVDLGLTFTSMLKRDLQVASVVRKANSVLYRMRKVFTYMSPGSMGKIFTIYLSPILEYDIAVWSRASKILSGLRNQHYHQRLASLGLTTLELRRTAFDLMETYKILRGMYTTPLNQLFLMATTTHLRGHPLKLRLQRAIRLQRGNFLGCRVVC